LVRRIPSFLTFCGGGDRGPSEPLDVTNPNVYTFVHALYDEISELWPDEWIHVGGDEVSQECWKNSTAIQTWMKKHGMNNTVELLGYFEHDLLEYVTGTLGKRSIVWQELFDSGLSLPKGTIVDVWKGGEGGRSTRTKATSQSFQVLLSACWYLDHLDADWWFFYSCDPRDFNATDAQKALVIGGHASMWGEGVDETNFMPRVWPRASAMAEKLWTGNETLATQTAQERLEWYRCFMVRQGFPASPIAPGTCTHKVNSFSQIRASETVASNSAFKD
jgi:hexosaminidase